MRPIDKKFFIRFAVMGVITFIALAFLHELCHLLVYNLLFPDMVDMGYSAWIELRGLLLYTFWWKIPAMTVIDRLLIQLGGGIFPFLCLLMRNKMNNPGYFVPAVACSVYTLIEVVFL